MNKNFLAFTEIDSNGTRTEVWIRKSNIVAVTKVNDVLAEQVPSGAKVVVAVEAGKSVLPYYVVDETAENIVTLLNK